MIKKFNNKKGFSLVEIIAVLIIFSVITSIAIFKIINIGETAKNTQKKYEEKGIERSATYEYYLKDKKDGETIDDFIKEKKDEYKK